MICRFIGRMPCGGVAPRTAFSGTSGQTILVMAEHPNCLRSLTRNQAFQEITHRLDMLIYSERTARDSSR